jgi:Uma2 family endonuclease
MAVELLAKPRPLKPHKLQQERITFEQFCELIHEDQKADLIDGVIYMQSPPSIPHEIVFGFLLHLVDIYVRHKKLGDVVGSRAAARLGKHDGPEPDLMFISKERQHIIKFEHVDGAPDLIVEIISQGAAYIDRSKKKKQYAKFGVREYWLINPNKQTAEFFINREGQWESLPITAEGVFHSVVMPGFWLHPDWLFAKELPDPLETVMKILNIDLPKE